jgi:hypothetical protein
MSILSDICVALQISILKIFPYIPLVEIFAHLDLKQNISLLNGHWIEVFQSLCQNQEANPQNIFKCLSKIPPKGRVVTFSSLVEAKRKSA